FNSTGLTIRPVPSGLPRKMWIRRASRTRTATRCCCINALKPKGLIRPVAGSSGRVLVDYNTVDGSTNMLNNGDVPAVANQDYTPVSGTLIFDDFEMS